MFAFLYTLWISSRRRAFRLRDGRRVAVRDLAPHDRRTLRSFFSSLSLQSRQRRFHGAVGEVPDALIDHLMRASVGARSLVASVHDGEREVMVAEARFAAADSETDRVRGSAEFALVVADDLRGQGLGRHLLKVLMHAAAAAGYARLAGDVLADNRSMLSLAESLGFSVCRHPDDARLLRVVRRVSTVTTALTTATTPHLGTLPAAVRSSA